MRSRPAVSVLLGCYNHADHVEQALDSVAAQRLRDFELIVTDDCSADRSVEVIRRWLGRYDGTATLLANERNVGICAVRNRALAVAKGRFVCALAGDDWYGPDRLERQHEFFASLPEDVGFVYSDLRVCSPDSEVLEPSWVARWADAFQVRHLPGVVTNKRRLPTSMSQSRAARPRLLASQAKVLLKWAGREMETDGVIAARVRSAASGLAPWDPTAPGVPAAMRGAVWALDRVRRRAPG